MDKRKRYFSNIIIFLVTAPTFLGVWKPTNFVLGLLAAILAAVITKLILDKLLTETDSKLPKLTRQKEDFYKSKGLSNEDISFFRQTMLNAKNHILEIEAGFNGNSKLRAIEKRNNTLEISKTLFNDIVKEPQRLHKVNQFLYVHLPSLSDLIQKHNRIDNHKAKSKATYDILTKSAKTIDELSQEITNDYLEFKDADLSSLDTSVDVTKQTMNQDFNHSDI